MRLLCPVLSYCVTLRVIIIRTLDIAVCYREELPRIGTFVFSHSIERAEDFCIVVILFVISELPQESERVACLKARRPKGPAWSVIVVYDGPEFVVATFQCIRVCD